MKVPSLLPLILLSLPLSAQTPSACLSALRRALDGRADWTMERSFGNGGRALVSSGTVACVANSGIVWRVTSPFESSVAMTTNAMVFSDGEGTRTKELSELPHYADIRTRTDAFSAGDARAFDGLFAVDAAETGAGGWRLVLKPEIGAMRRLLEKIELTGSALPTNAVLETGDGGRCVIRFRERENVR